MTPRRLLLVALVASVASSHLAAQWIRNPAAAAHRILVTPQRRDAWSISVSIFRADFPISPGSPRWSSSGGP
jgi:hypothetical protein